MDIINATFAIAIVFTLLALGIIRAIDGLRKEQHEANATHTIMLGDIVETVHRARRDDLVRMASAVKLSVEPGDVVLFRIDARLLPEDVERVRDRMAETLPEGVKFQLISSLVDVTVLSPDK